jgi:hypothetical protein
MTPRGIISHDSAFNPAVAGFVAPVEANTRFILLNLANSVGWSLFLMHKHVNTASTKSVHTTGLCTIENQNLVTRKLARARRSPLPGHLNQQELTRSFKPLCFAHDNK